MFLKHSLNPPHGGCCACCFCMLLSAVVVVFAIVLVVVFIISLFSAHEGTCISEGPPEHATLLCVRVLNTLYLAERLWWLSK